MGENQATPLPSNGNHSHGQESQLQTIQPFEGSQHQYTRSLLGAVPALRTDREMPLGGHFAGQRVSNPGPPPWVPHPNRAFCG